MDEKVKEAIQKAYQAGIAYQKQLDSKVDPNQPSPSLDTTNRIVISKKEYEALKKGQTIPSDKVLIDKRQFELIQMLKSRPESVFHAYLENNHLVALDVDEFIAMKEQLETYKDYKSIEEVEVLLKKAYELGKQEQEKSLREQEASLRVFDTLQEKWNQFDDQYHILQVSPHDKAAQSNLLLFYIQMLEKIPFLEEEAYEDWNQIVHSLPLLNVANLLRKNAFILYNLLEPAFFDQLASLLDISIQKQNDLLETSEEVWIYSLFAKKE